MSAAAGGMSGRGNGSTRRKSAPSAALSVRNPTWPDVGLKPGHRGVQFPAGEERFLAIASSILDLWPSQCGMKWVARWMRSVSLNTNLQLVSRFSIPEALPLKLLYTVLDSLVL
jgi:hypothetical protein